MGLLDLKTDLKSLKFGVLPASDRPQGGNSGEPYIKKSIDRNPIPQSEDFLLRGGINAPLDAATDVARLSKFFADLKSPRGALFVAKQNILSRTGVATQASDIINWKEAPLNEGVYTPLSTLAQAGVGFTGAHLPKQGAIPFMGVRTYLDAKSQIIGLPSGVGNRLVNFLNTNQTNEDNSIVNLYSYSGGPGSDLGIGKTNIKFATDNKGAPLRTGINSLLYSEIKSKVIDSKTNNTPGLPSFNASITDLRSYQSPPQLENFKVPPQVDFRTRLLGGIDTTTIIPTFKQDVKTSTVMSIAPSYSPKDGKTIDGADGSRINYTSPGQRGNIISYTTGKIVNGRVSIVDKINAQPIYQSKQVTEDNDVKNDLVKFRIAALNNENPNLKQYIHFRAYIDSFSDTYGAGWSGTSYMGRGEKFWKYGGFDRDINLSFTVAAQSKPELMAQYKKLNFLASNLAPVYSSKGYMGGPLVTLTMGGWCYELPGFIKGLTLDVPTESPWEIGIDDGGEFDPTVKEMPHIVKVTGFSFVPIHTFRPEKQQNLYGGEPDGGLTEPANISKYGPQRYLALKATDSNYDDKIIDNGKI